MKNRMEKTNNATKIITMKTEVDKGYIELYR